MSEIEKKIKEDNKKTIKLSKENKLNGKILKAEMFKHAPELKGKMSISIMLACIGESLGFASYIFAAVAGKALLEGNVTSRLYLYSLLAILAIVLQKVLTRTSSMMSHRISFTILQRLREALSRKLEKISLGYVLEKPIGYFKAIIVERVASLEDWIAHVMPELPSRLLHPILASVILFLADWRLGLACFIPVPFVVIGMMTMMYKREERMHTWLNANADLNSRIIEYVNGINVIKAFGQADNSYKKFTDSVNFYHSSTMGWWRSSWLGTAIMFAFATSPLLGTLPVGIHLYSKGAIDISRLMLGLILPLSIIPNSFQLIMSVELYSMIETSWIMIKKLLELPEQNRPSENVELDDSKCFEFENVAFSYTEDSRVLENVSFTVPKNSVFAIVGESGSGKSTLAKLMMSFFDAGSGEIRFGGKSVKDIPTDQLMKNLAYVAQDNFLFDTSLKENLKIANPNASDEEIKRALEAANCMELIERLPKGIESSAGDAGALLSGGERQRFTLARAMLSDAECVILDEATAYADPENEAKIQQAISKLIKDKTLIVVAHRLHTIVDADNILVLKKGNVEAIGKHDELISSCDEYKKLWRHYTGKEAA